jgi:hypothetical protein
VQYILPALASASNLVDRLLDGYEYRAIFKITFAGYSGRPEFCKRKIRLNKGYENTTGRIIGELKKRC